MRDWNLIAKLILICQIFSKSNLFLKIINLENYMHIIFVLCFIDFYQCKCDNVLLNIFYKKLYYQCNCVHFPVFVMNLLTATLSHDSKLI